jgi:hypothetical protein
MLPNRIFAFMHIKLFVDNMLIGFQKVKILYYHTLGCNSGLLLINMFLQGVQLGHHEFFFLFNDIVDFAFNLCHLPINTHNKFFPKQFL